MIPRLLALLAFAATAAGAQTPAVAVWSAPDDPLHATALRIADAEAAPLVPSLDAALDSGAAYVLWVVASNRLSDSSLVELGRSLRTEGAPAVGIITGADPLEALAFWMRGRDAMTGRVAAAVAARPRGGPRPGLLTAPTPAASLAGPAPLTVGALTAALASAGYVTFTGHGGPTYLRLGEDRVFRAADVPALPGTVVTTASCSTFRPWVDGALVPALVERGAAAYAGFAYSPVAGYLPGAYEGLAFRYAWPGFPIGRIAQVQARATLRAFAAFPFYYLAGDPRIVMRRHAPYRVAVDRAEGDTRRMVLQGAPPAILPVRIVGGAAYDFVRVTGVGASARRGFYNARLQWLDRSGDRYLLVRQAGGQVEILLRRKAPWSWRWTAPARNALDHALLTGGPSDHAVAVVLAGLILAVVLWRRRKDPAPAAWMAAAALGLGMALLHAGYMAARVEAVTITSRAIGFQPLALLATFALAAVAGLVFLESASWKGRAAAIALALLPAWGGALFWTAITGAFNLIVFRPRFGGPLYDPAPARLFALAALLLAPLVAAAFAGAAAALRRQPATAPPVAPDAGAGA